MGTGRAGRVNVSAVATALHALADALVADAAAPAPDSGCPVLTVADVAARLHRSKSTVRGWLEAGHLAGAFKLNGRDWRVPSQALEAFLAGQQPKPSPQDAPHGTIAPPADTTFPRRRARKAAGADLGAWRRAS